MLLFLVQKGVIAWSLCGWLRNCGWMVSEKRLLHVVDRSVFLKIQEIMHVNYRSGTNSSQFQGADRWCVRARVVQGEHGWADTASSDPLHLAVHAQGWRIWGNVVCSQHNRKAQEIPDSHEVYCKAVRLARRDCCLPQDIFGKLQRMGTCQRAQGGACPHFPRKRNEGRIGDLPTYLHVNLDKELQNVWSQQW